MTKLSAIVLILTTAACSAAGTDTTTTEPGELGRTAEALGAQPAVHEIALSTGVTISYLEQGASDGLPVIFLHGYSDSWHSFDLNLPLLPDRFHVYALDQRGHGHSSKPACCYTQADFASDVIAFMDAMHLNKATLVGHSMGSLIAHKVAASNPKRVQKMVLIGSGPTLAGNQVALSFQPIVDSLVDPVDQTFIREFQASTFYQPIPDSFLDTSVAESSLVPATVWQQALSGLLAEDHTSELPNVKAKTLILWGDQDIFFGAQDQQTLDTAIPRSTLIVYQETGHGLHVERPTRFVQDLTAFLDEDE